MSSESPDPSEANQHEFDHLNIPEGARREVVDTPDGPCPIHLKGEGKDVVLILRGFSNYAHPSIEAGYRKNEKEGKPRDFDLWNEGELASSILEGREAKLTVVTTQYQTHFYDELGHPTPKPLENYSTHLQAVLKHLREIDGLNVVAVVGESGGAVPILDYMSRVAVETSNPNLPSPVGEGTESESTSLRSVPKDELKYPIPQLVCMNAFLGLNAGMEGILKGLQKVGIKVDLANMAELIDQNSDFLLNLRMRVGSLARTEKLHFLGGDSTVPVHVAGKIPPWMAGFLGFKPPYGDGMTSYYPSLGEYPPGSLSDGKGDVINEVVPIAPRIDAFGFRDDEGVMYHFYKPWKTTAVPKILQMIGLE